MRSVPQFCRSRLQSRDLEFIAQVLAGSDEIQRSALYQFFESSKALEELLEHPALLSAVLALKHPLNISPELYFYVLVRQELKEAGIDHIEVADYVAATLAEHARGNPYQGQDTGIGQLPYHVDFITAINEASAYDRFYLYVRCGNQFLTLTGLFPKFFEHREERRGAPGVLYYEGVARDSFRYAGNHPLASEFALDEVYHTLADELPRARRALNRMAREYLFLGA